MSNSHFLVYEFMRSDLSKCYIKSMPSKHTVRFYTENGIYHVYNRGVEKRIVFQDKQDYLVFLHYLKKYLTPPQENEVRPQSIANLHLQVELLAYCLMPNHFHLLIRQMPPTALTTFMRCLMNSYTKYFNTKYVRVGPLFQGKFKAVLVENDQYLLHLSRYIHLNPMRSDLISRNSLIEYPYSSYAEYLGIRQTVWIKSESVLEYFKDAKKTFFTNMLSYQSFIEDYAVPPEEFLGSLVIEDE